MGTMIQAVGAAWLMTSISSSAQMVALVQSSAALPVLIFALLSGAVADLYDRRAVMLLAQSVALAGSVVLAALAFMHLVTPWLLLAFTFLVGCGVALNGPAWQASVGEQVPREDLAGAVALNSMGFNIARALGPAIGGAIVAAVGAAANFVVNALSYVGLIGVLLGWRRKPLENPLPREPLGSAMIAGLRYARMAANIRGVLFRTFLFGVGASAVWALLPLVARETLGRGAGTYGLLLGALGLGAVAGAFASAALRRRLSVEALVRWSAAAFALAAFTAGISTFLSLTFAVMLLGGAAWVLTLSSFNVSIQMAAPRWVVGRLMSLFQMSLFGGMAVGSWGWGRLTETITLGPSLALSAGAIVLTIAVGWRRPLPDVNEHDLSPLRMLDAAIASAPGRGAVITCVEYRVRPEDAEAFVQAIREKGRIRRRDGARRWSLLHELSDPELWVERFHVSDWGEHLRLRSRPTLADREAEERVRAFHVGPGPARVRRFLEH